MTSAITLNFRDDAAGSVARRRALPEWVLDLVRAADQRPVERRDGAARVETIHAGGYAIVRACVTGASGMSDGELEAATVRAYGTIFEQLSALPAKYPLRLWNYLPGIHDPMGGGRDRYMVFNAGRFKAFEKWYGGCGGGCGGGGTAPRWGSGRPRGSG